MRPRLPVFLFCSVLLLISCQSQPTLLKQEVSSQDNKNLVLVDTRSAFDFTGFHLSGSVNLNSGDFLILKNPKTGRRILDPDINQIVERLAHRGISPLRSIILLAEKKDSAENKKWRWLLNQLQIRDVVMMSIEEFRIQKKNLVPQATPTAVSVWEVKGFKNILSKADRCFVNWTDSDCD